MSKTEELKNTKEIVASILKTSKRAREYDETLFCLVLNKLGTSWESRFCDVMEKIENGELPKLESIRRCRQKLQEENPDLRGENYEIKHTVVKQEVEDFIIGG